MNSQKLKCVVFDMDGTLTQTNELIYDSFNHIAEKYIKKRLTPKEIVAYFGPPEEEAVRNLIGSEHIDEAMNEYYYFYQKYHDRLATLYPGIKDLLIFLRGKGMILGLFTGKGRRTTEITLRAFDIARYFDIVMTGDDVDHFKPSGDGLRKIMQRFSLSADELLMVGDSVADIRASRDGGVAIASVLWDSYSKDHVLQVSTDYVFHSVAEFRLWLEGELHNTSGTS